MSNFKPLISPEKIKEIYFYILATKMDTNIINVDILFGRAYISYGAAFDKNMIKLKDYLAI